MYRTTIVDTFTKPWLDINLASAVMLGDELYLTLHPDAPDNQVHLHGELHAKARKQKVYAVACAQSYPYENITPDWAPYVKQPIDWIGPTETGWVILIPENMLNHASLYIEGDTSWVIGEYEP